MRISTDPTDPAFIDARPRKVWYRGNEVPNWIVADEFRRVIEVRDGAPLFGDVLIERLPAEGEPAVEAPPPAAPINTFSGMLVPVPPPAAPPDEPLIEVPTASRVRR